MRNARLFLLTALLVFASCSGKDSDPLTSAIEKQMQAQEKGDSLSYRIQVRRAALNHLKTHYPGWAAQGISIFANGGNDYEVGVDAISGNDRQTIRVEVELFVPDSGETYWKTTLVPPKPGAKPMEFVIEKYLPR